MRTDARPPRLDRTATRASTATAAAEPLAERDAQDTQFYGQMYLIRRVEQSLLDLFSQGLLTGTVHTALGQEACAVGVVNALDRERDVIFSSHRAHGHFLVYTDDVDGLIAEVMGRRTGVCGGVGGTQNLHARNMYTGGIQGGIVPCAVGAALAEKLKGSGAIAVVFLGDGTMGQGAVYEGLNVASLWSLPLLFVLEDNQYAQSTPKALEHAGDIATRPETFAVDRTVVDVDDVRSAYAAAQRAVRHVREQSRPFFLVLNTYRLGPHSKGDDTRSPVEIEAYRARDPLPRLAARLGEAERAEIEAQVEERVRQAVQAALEAGVQDLAEFAERMRWHTR